MKDISPTRTLFFLAGAVILFSQEGSSEFDNFFHRQSWPWEELSRIIGRPSLDLFIEDIYDFGVGNLAAIGPYTAPDRESYALNGNPHRWHKFYDSGFDVTDRFFPGASLHKFELNEQNLFIDPHHAYVHITPVNRPVHSLYLDSGGGRFGGEDLDTSVDFQAAIVGRRGTHPLERPDRDELLAERRRQSRYHLELKQNYHTGEKNQWFFRNLNQWGRRSFLSFDHEGIDGSYDENYWRLHFSVDRETRNPSANLCLRAFRLRYSHLQRDHLYAEDYYARDESAQLDQDNLSFWFDLRSKANFEIITGLNLSYKAIDHYRDNFSRNIIDQDGTGFEPWYASADILEISQNNRFNWDFSVRRLDRFALTGEVDQALLAHFPHHRESHHAVFYQTDSTNTSLHVRRYRHEDFAYYLGRIRLGLVLEKNFFPEYLKLKLRVDFILDSIFTSRIENSLALPDFQFLFAVDWVDNRHFYTGFTIGWESVPLTSDIARFLAPEHLNGALEYWEDANGDNLFQEGESTGVYRNTGGRHHRPDGNLRHPSYFYLDLPLQVKMGKHAAFSITLSYKSYQNLFRVRYAKDSSAYGHRETVTSGHPGTVSQDQRDNPSYQVYVIDRGEEIEYILDQDRGYSNPGNTSISANPFYAGAYFKFVSKGKRWYISLAFGAYMVVGRSGFGNGYDANSLGFLSEQSANPNADIRSLGRTSNDRAYIGKMVLSGEMFRHFWVSMVMKYRDGEPFSHYLTSLHGVDGRSQAALWKRDINGDTLVFGGEFGSRKDALWNLDFNFIYALPLKGNRTLRAYFQIYNVMDLAAELVEKTFKSGRSALELQPPRGFQTGLSFHF